MTCGDKLWSFRTPFRHPETIVSDGTQRQITVILHLLSSRGGKPDDMRRQIMVIPHTFSPSGDNRVRWHADTNYGHSAPFRHPEMIESEGTHRQIMVILDHLSFRGGEPDDMRRQIMVIPHLFTIRRRSSPMACGEELWSF